MDGGSEFLRLVDRFAIERVMYEYCRTADAKDPDGFVALFTSDCRVLYDPEGEWLLGRGELYDAVSAGLDGFAATSHVVTNIAIDFSAADTATSESVITAWHRNVNGTEWTLHGRYLDRWSRTDGAWLIEQRVKESTNAIPIRR